MRWLLAVLVFILLVLQYRLWVAQGSLAEQRRLERQVEEQTAVNAQLQQRNAILEREVRNLKSGNSALEQHAREQLGLVREGETFFQFGAPGREKASGNGANPPSLSTDPETAQ